MKRLVFAMMLMAMSGVACADSYHRGPGIAPIENALYRDECGSCHFAYQPGLLPSASWNKIMSGLDRHYGENAELADDVRMALTQYLADNAADKVEGYKRSARIMRSLKGRTPVRILEIPFLRHEHNEIPRRFIKTNSEVRSLSQCDACHTRAAEGYYSERYVRIPGIGRWDD